MTKKRLPVALSATVALAAFLMISSSAYAKNDSPKPGWGYGDENHIHVGPPGHSTHPVSNLHEKFLDQQKLFTFLRQLFLSHFFHKP